MYRKFSVNDTI